MNWPRRHDRGANGSPENAYLRERLAASSNGKVGIIKTSREKPITGWKPQSRSRFFSHNIAKWVVASMPKAMSSNSGCVDKRTLVFSTQHCHFFLPWLFKLRWMFSCSRLSIKVHGGITRPDVVPFHFFIPLITSRVLAIQSSRICMKT